ncbi:hypothetical protein D3C76_395200 [compost metagenome]
MRQETHDGADCDEVGRRRQVALSVDAIPGEHWIEGPGGPVPTVLVSAGNIHVQGRAHLPWVGKGVAGFAQQPPGLDVLMTELALLMDQIPGPVEPSPSTEDPRTQAIAIIIADHSEQFSILLLQGHGIQIEPRALSQLYGSVQAIELSFIVGAVVEVVAVVTNQARIESIDPIISRLTKRHSKSIECLANIRTFGISNQCWRTICHLLPTEPCAQLSGSNPGIAFDKKLMDIVSPFITRRLNILSPAARIFHLPKYSQSIVEQVQVTVQLKTLLHV